jgi:hypothetical protein
MHLAFSSPIFLPFFRLQAVDRGLVPRSPGKCITFFRILPSRNDILSSSPLRNIHFFIVLVTLFFYIDDSLMPCKCAIQRRMARV